MTMQARSGHGAEEVPPFLSISLRLTRRIESERYTGGGWIKGYVSSQILISESAIQRLIPEIASSNSTEPVLSPPEGAWVAQFSYLV